MQFVPVDIGPAENASIWIVLDKIQMKGFGATMTPSQIRILLDERDRLIEKANATTRSQ